MENNFDYCVVTHNGKAHLDEVIAIALLATYMNTPPKKIKRVSHELAKKFISKGFISPKLFYIDCGNDFSIEKNIYDHHHDDLPSSAKLIFNRYFPELKGTELDLFISKLSDIDNYGPKQLSDFNINSESVNYFKYPSKLLIKLFEDNPVLVINVFKDAISKNISELLLKKEAQKWLSDNSNIKIFNYKSINIMIYNKPPESRISSYVKSLDGEIIDKFNIDLTYSFDKDNVNIRTLFRTFKGDDKLDFNLAQSIKPIFSHKSGFLFKFIPKSEKDWLTIIDEAIIV